MKNAFLFLLAILAISCQNTHQDLPDGLYAEFDTDKGTIITSLEYDLTPVTVANFITLAEGLNEFVNQPYKDKPFYDGLTFHRVEKGFMIQGGDPNADGSGGPGYKFTDEFSNLKHNKSGTLSMANAGPGTNGSQFFITHVPTPFLDGRHTVFGYVVGNGMETVNAIEIGDVINSVKIIRIGEKAKNFDAEKIFREYVVQDREATKKQASVDAEKKMMHDEKYKPVFDKQAAYLASVKKNARKTATGVHYAIIQKGSGKKIAKGKNVTIPYSGWLENGQLVDTSSKEMAEQYGIFDQSRADHGQYRPIPFVYGQRGGLIPGLLDGINQLSAGDKALIFIPAHLGYGPQGAGDIIPPNANLIFEIEMLEQPVSK